MQRETKRYQNKLNKFAKQSRFYLAGAGFPTTSKPGTTDRDILGVTPGNSG